mgnify:CR=1 FL=1
MSFIEIKNLEKSYFGHKALKGINLEINEGEIVGLFGPHGSGKTTLIKILSNLLMRYNGEVLIDGHKPGIETKKIVSYFVCIFLIYATGIVLGYFFRERSILIFLICCILASIVFYILARRLAIETSKRYEQTR